MLRSPLLVFNTFYSLLLLLTSKKNEISCPLKFETLIEDNYVQQNKNFNYNPPMFAKTILPATELGFFISILLRQLIISSNKYKISSNRFVINRTNKILVVRCAELEYILTDPL